ncbi:unnamed protein product, partial [Onchocerca ochengi]
EEMMITGATATATTTTTTTTITTKPTIPITVNITSNLLITPERSTIMEQNHNQSEPNNNEQFLFIDENDKNELQLTNIEPTIISDWTEVVQITKPIIDTNR